MALQKSARGIALQDRDYEILRGLFDSRILTLAQIASLYFEGRDEAAKKRVQKLKAAGLIAERPRRAYEPAILSLTRSALHLLEAEGFLADAPKLSVPALERRAKVSDLTLRHELDVQEVKAALTRAINAKKGFRVAEFHTWPARYQFTVHRDNTLVKPDAFIRVVEEDKSGQRFERMFFLEVDRSTESQNVVGKRAACYREYYRSGKFAEWRGGKRDEFEQYPFRVLWTFKTGARQDNAARTMLALNPPLLSMSYLTTQAEMLPDPLGSIWRRPVDYRNNPDTAQRLSLL